jgi:hypothetical protein
MAAVSVASLAGVNETILRAAGRIDDKTKPEGAYSRAPSANVFGR